MAAASYIFSTLNDGDQIAFAAASKLTFDDAGTTPDALRFGLPYPTNAATTDLTLSAVAGPEAGKDIVLLDFNLARLSTNSFIFASHGKVFVGDGTTAALDDDLANTITGTASGDLLIGLGGDDTMNGGAGADSFYLVVGRNGTYGNDAINGGAGIDTVVCMQDALFGVTVNLTTNLVIGGDNQTRSSTSGATLTSIENVIATGKSDVIFGNDLANMIDAGVGSDRLIGNGGADTLLGGTGSDHLDGGAGTDSLVGGGGDDTMIGGGGADTLLGMGGNDYFGQGADGGNDVYDGGAGHDVFISKVGSGDDTMIGSGATAFFGAHGETVNDDYLVYRDASLTTHGTVYAFDARTDNFDAGVDRLDLSAIFNSFGFTYTTIAQAQAAGALQLLEIAGGLGDGGTPDVAVKIDANGGGDSYAEIYYLVDTSLADLSDAHFILQ